MFGSSSRITTLLARSAVDAMLKILHLAFKKMRFVLSVFQLFFLLGLGAATSTVLGRTFSLRGVFRIVR